MLSPRCMARPEPDESWTIPFEILIWTVLGLGAIAILVIWMLGTP